MQTDRYKIQYERAQKSTINFTWGLFISLWCDLFLIPVNIATGGTPGMSIILHYLTDIPTALAMVLINIPLVFAGLKFIDFRFAARTVVATILTATFVDLLPIIISFSPIDSILLSTIYGGVCIGAGISIVIKGQASAGGTTIVT
jgi:uncharacterized membrane-anchored protein YitT (DUF2179 family)